MKMNMFRAAMSGREGKKGPVTARRIAVGAMLAAVAGVASLATVVAAGPKANLVRLTPTGDVPGVQQVQAQFDRDVGVIGKPQANPPFEIRCKPAQSGQGAWVDARRWSYRFDSKLPAGVACQAVPVADAGIAQQAPIAFGTGMPRVEQAAPSPQSEAIDPSQVFALRWSGAVSADAVRAAARCEVRGLAERVPVDLVGGADRSSILEHLGWTDPVRDVADRVVLVKCRNQLPEGGQMTLVVAGDAANSAGFKTFKGDFRVLAPFTWELSCTRERSDAACSPLAPVEVVFSAPVPRKLAQHLVLKAEPGSQAGSAAGQAFERKAQLPQGDGGAVERVSFVQPWPEKAQLRLIVPADLTDDAGRPPKAGQPLTLKTASYPPLAKFPGHFGVLERAEGGVLPITVRKLDADLTQQKPRVSVLTLTDDAAMIAALRRYLHLGHDTITHDARGADRVPVPSKPAANDDGYTPDPNAIEARTLSLLAAGARPGSPLAGVQRSVLPAVEGGVPMQVVGLPLQKPGLHIVELQSPVLGKTLTDTQRPLYARTAALVSNLAVHFKHGRAGSAVWVTRLDTGKPVAGAKVAVSDCAAQTLWEGVTDAKGVARIDTRLVKTSCDNNNGVPNDPWLASGAAVGKGALRTGMGMDDLPGLFVSARHGDDLAFTLSSWNDGLEPWRFDVATRSPGYDDGGDDSSDWRAHTVFDRVLVRAGDTVSMKHFVRKEVAGGLAYPPLERLPNQVKLTHQGSDQSYTASIQWNARGSGVSQVKLPREAKRGQYSVELQPDQASAQRHPSGKAPILQLWAGQFAVSDFRLPTMLGSLTGPAAGADASKDPRIAPKELRLQAQLSFANGGPAANLPMTVTAGLQSRSQRFDGYDNYQFFDSYQPAAADGSVVDGEGDGEGSLQVFADKLALTLDAQGSAQLVLKDLPAVRRPSVMLAEATYADPNGAQQTLKATVPLWPSGVQIGLSSDGWSGLKEGSPLRAVVLDTAGKPVAGAKVKISAVNRQWLSYRKRLVGGFYAYDNRAEDKPIGEICQGASDARGRMICPLAWPKSLLSAGSAGPSGEIFLIAETSDAQGRVSRASQSVWVGGHEESWMGAGNLDRIDLLPEKPRYQPGDVAKLQVRMPYRRATALVSIEREGVITTDVVDLSGKDPTIQVPVLAEHTPNVFVSVLVVRGRVQPTDWKSFFSWGWKSPLVWWDAWQDARSTGEPTAMVDLAKPSFRLGLAELQVDTQGQALQVEVLPAKEQLRVRDKLAVTLRVKLPDGTPARGAEVAFAAVDESLLALADNDSVHLLPALYQRRPLGVETSTNQLQVVGKRHYGLKAAAAGGGGGRGATRELLDTLLSWQPRVQLDDKGEAIVQLTMNDQLSSFRLVAIADEGTGRFGVGRATVRTVQELQLISGLAPVMRDGDSAEVAVTVRNGTDKPMTVHVSAAAQLGLGEAFADGAALTSALAAGLPSLKPQQIELPAQGAHEVRWPISVPDLGKLLSAAQTKSPALASSASLAQALTNPDGMPIRWSLDAQTKDGGFKDSLRVEQRWLPSVPLAVIQATLVQVDPAKGQATMPVAVPDGARPGAGGLTVQWSNRLTSSGQEGVTRWLAAYPFRCLEQRTSRAIGLRDGAMWAQLSQDLPTYLDADGLAAYFPIGDGAGHAGSELLTAYLLSVSDAAGRSLPDEAKAKMLQGLANAVEGKLARQNNPQSRYQNRETPVVLKLTMMEALARHGKLPARMLGTIAIEPETWPTASLIDWWTILQRLPTLPDRDKQLQRVQNLLRARLDLSGTRLTLTDDKEVAWWRMGHGDVDALRLVLAAMGGQAERSAQAVDAGWRDDLPRMMRGALARQQRGAWATTVANSWGAVALQAFAAGFERQAVAGVSTATLGSITQSVDWAKLPVQAGAQGGAGDGEAPVSAQLMLPWPASSANLSLSHKGQGAPWATVIAQAAVPLAKPLNQGYQIKRSVSAVQRKLDGVWSRGDVVKVTLDITVAADQGWVVVSDPIPAGASLLGDPALSGNGNGSGGRDSTLAVAMAQQQADAPADGGRGVNQAWPTFEERTFDSYRAYFAALAPGTWRLSYTMRLNAAGSFQLPPAKVEAMYAPDVQGQLPVAAWKIQP